MIELTPIMFFFSNKPYNIDVHLSRQHYKACVRKAAGKGYICYTDCTSIVGTVTATAGVVVITQVRVGALSNHQQLND